MSGNMGWCSCKRLTITLITVSLVGVAVFVGVWFSSSSIPPAEVWDHYRLPETLVPERYDVMLWPRLDPDTEGLYIFTGNSTVRFRCLKNTNLIILHCNLLTLTTLGGYYARLTALSGTAPGIEKTWLHLPMQYLVVHLKEDIQAGQDYELYTEFAGLLLDDLEGLYRSEYFEDGVKK